MGTQAADKVELKHCPFCGPQSLDSCKPVLDSETFVRYLGHPSCKYRSSIKDVKLVFVECQNCGSSSGRYMTGRQAADHWNIRGEE